MKQKNKFQCLGTLGEGSYGVVYKLEDAKGRIFALKEIRVKPFDTESALKEIDVMKTFLHPNLVKIYDYNFDSQTNKLDILMEYCEGGNLTSYARANHFRLQSEEILNIFKQIVMAFLAMNAKRVIHRDLKPDNILISKGMVIKIADFGCARFVEKEKMSVTIKDNLSVGIGTPLFSSPEVLTDQMYSAKCDVWSAGCLLYSICEGGNPFAQKEKDIITCIKELMVNGQIRLKTKNSNPKICRLISLTLVFTEKERATWRELWLSRLFVPSVDNVWAFVQYLQHVMIISRWIQKDFWKVKRVAKSEIDKEYVFLYFLVKYQYTCMKMAMDLLNHELEYAYLFTDSAFSEFLPTPAQKERIASFEKKNKEHFETVKAIVMTKPCAKQISEREPERVNCFLDLDNSIRSGYRILSDAIEVLDKQSNEAQKTWLVLAQWTNFEHWFSYEKQPRVEKIMCQNFGDIPTLIKEEKRKYDAGEFE